jgi:uncharacterized protein
MLEEIRQIQNPLTRSVTAACAAFAVTTIVSGVVVGLTNTAEKATYGIYASLIGTSCGAVAGLFPGKKTGATASTPDENTRLSSPQTITDDRTWQDWRNFVVVRKVKESEEITSFYLKPEDQAEIPNFQPGQFLTIKLVIPGQPKPIIRTYSLSDAAEPCEYYRLSIKREPAPKGLDVPAGIASNFMHDQVQAGSVILVKPPSGRFCLDVQQSIPVVLISNGVGITPLISMAKACSRLNPRRQIWFLHGARDGQYHAFRDEVRGIARQNSNLHIHIAYSRPKPEDVGLYDSTGYVDATLVRSLVEQNSEFFLCGSPPFLRSVIDGLKAWGVPEGQIFFESFGQPMTMATQKPLVAPPSAERVTEAEIIFARSDRTLTWHEGDGSILEFAEANGLNPDYSCRQGICGTCMCNIREGAVVYQEPPTAVIHEGSVLTCISQPKTSTVVLDL